MMSQTTFQLRLTPRILTGILFGIFLAVTAMLMPGSILIGEAEARPGRSVSPARVARVARHTTRRRHYVRHHTRIRLGSYVRILPSRCTTVISRGIRYRVCGNVYYRPYYEGNTVVYVVVARP